MAIEEQSDGVIVAELGGRLQAERLNRNLSQQELANQAGIGRVTLSRIERGGDFSMTTLVKLLRVFDELGAIDDILPGTPVSPVAVLHGQTKKRQRSSKPRSTEPKDATWAWGEGR